MPRKRMLYPEFFESLPLAELSLEAAYTYAGFWCFADDRGRMLHNPGAVLAKVWQSRADHVTTADVDHWLDELIAGEQLCRYKVGGGMFLHCVAWDEHQKISHATPSKLPPCPDHQPAEWAVWLKDDDTAGARWRKAERAAREAARDSGKSPEKLRNQSGATPPQCSSVQGSSVQATTPSNVTKFTRPSQRGVS